MPRELITVQVGQCGNQIGMGFWNLALKEHAKNSKNNLFDDSLSSFFRNVDSRNQPMPYNDGQNKIANLRARTVIVDMEENVINQLMRSEIGELFEQTQRIQDVSGAGNNWGHGFGYYGPKYEEEIIEKVRKEAEPCDSLQCFLLFHSTGGGTGSGLGSYILNILNDHFEKIFRFTASVLPSKDDVVAVSPYNSIFSLNELIKCADCVLPIDNQALFNIFEKSEHTIKKKGPGDGFSFGNNEEVKVKGSKIVDAGEETKKTKPYEKMNNIIAHVLSNLTCSMRFEGILNVDLNEITMNLVPFPKLHFLVPSLAPLYTLADLKLQPRSLDQMFKDCLSPDNQLICASPLEHMYIAMGLMIRGNVAFSDVNRNINLMKQKMNTIYWNKEGFKYGICNVPSVGQSQSVLCLSNNTCIKDTFGEMRARFNKLYSRKVYVHHYKEFIDVSHFDEAIHNVEDLYHMYDELENMQPPEKIPKLKPII